MAYVCMQYMYVCVCCVSVCVLMVYIYTFGITPNCYFPNIKAYTLAV